MKDSKDFSAVLFDLDGVLIDSYDAWFRQFQQTQRHFGYEPISEVEFRKHWGQSTEDDVRLFMPRNTVQEVRAYFLRHYEEYLKYLKLQPGVLELLALVQRLKLPAGCVTNSHQRIVMNTLEHFGIHDYFTTVVTADDVSIPKPGPEMILKACHALRVSPHDTIFIGDTQTDALAAAAAGCIFIGCRTDGEMRFENLHEFAEWLCGVIPFKHQCPYASQT